MALNLPTKSRKNLEIATHTLGQQVDVYQNLGPTTDSFVEVMRKRKETVMGPDKWEVVKERVTTTMEMSMFNFKEALKRRF